MKILHTADFHLRVEGDSRWKALEQVLALARARGVALLVISGDLFDREIDVARLRVPVRERLCEEPYRIVVLPGNHDVRAVTDSDYYGENVSVLSSAGCFVDVGDARIFGLPFENIEGEKILHRLVSMRHQQRADGFNILLYHGELLDVLFGRDDFGEEDTTSYMPFKLSYLNTAPFDYVLAGHFHTNFDVRRYRTERSVGYFVYPGSPVSITRKETGVRHANLLELGKEPRAVPLDTSHYEMATVELTAFDDADPLQAIRERLAACHENATVWLTVQGVVDLSRLDKTEAEFAAAVRNLQTPQVESIIDRWKDIGVVKSNDLFARSVTHLQAMDLDEETKQRVRRLLVDSMWEASGAH